MPPSSTNPESAVDPVILERLPHRPPFLFVERIVEEEDGRIVSEWNVPEDLFCFEGHYPGNPVLPGVLIQEHAFQTGALMIYGGSDSKDEAGTPVLTKVESARFRRIVRPGAKLTTEVNLIERLANARVCSGIVRSEGNVIARLAFVLALAEEAP